MTGRIAACFFNTNIDAVLQLTPSVLAALPARTRKEVESAARKGEGIEILLKKPIDIGGGRAAQRIGGEAGNCSQAFSALGVPSICHTNNGAGRMRRMLGKNVTLIGPDTPPSVHWVLEWKAGFLGSPASNRAILTHDKPNGACRMNERFERLVLKSTGEVAVAVMGGLHVADSGFGHPIGFARKLVKERIPVHLEFGCCSPAKARRIIRLAKGSFHSFGCNEVEAAEIGKDILGKTGAQRAIVHGPENVEIIFRKTWPFSGETQEQAAIFAAAVAAGKATLGHDPCREETACLVRHGLLRRRSSGVCRAECEKDEIHLSIPTWSAGKIRMTVGLGDAFAAAFLAFENGLL